MQRRSTLKNVEHTVCKIDRIEELKLIVDGVVLGGARALWTQPAARSLAGDHQEEKP